MSEKTLGSLLANIAEEKNEETRRTLKEEFLQRIEGHNEEKILRTCLTAAYFCKLKRIHLGYALVPPPFALKAEGFWLEHTEEGYWYCFN